MATAARPVFRLALASNRDQAQHLPYGSRPWHRSQIQVVAGGRVHYRLVPSTLGPLVEFQRPVDDEGRQPNHGK
jgi:hypothetical protein